MSRQKQVSVRNARFQQWEAMLTNRSKRSKLGSFLVHGVRPISLAIDHGWDIQTLLYDADRNLSNWADSTLRRHGGEQIAVSTPLMRELGEKTDEAPELIAQVALPLLDLSAVTPGPQFLGLVFDRPTSPGNIGSLVRSADAFGADAVIVTGHAADPFDPKSVRASTGSIFSLPVVSARSASDVSEWARRTVPGMHIVGTDEQGTNDLANHDFTAPTVVAIGNEAKGLSRGWREAVDSMVRIPMMNRAASSLNAASAGTVVLYEATRQRQA